MEQWIAEENVFQVLVVSNNMRKKAKRLNIIFEGEDRDRHELLLQTAKQARADAESDYRYWLYIDSLQVDHRQARLDGLNRAASVCGHLGHQLRAAGCCVRRPTR